MEIGSVEQSIEVSATEEMVQPETTALGRVVTDQAVTSLPLVNRNFAQILALSTGISVGVTNAGELGRGSGTMMVGRTSVNGSRAYDNSFQMDGAEVTDYHNSNAGTSPGAPVPNPDTIQEFKTQTAQSDASFGRYAGAQTNIVLKSGGDQFHGTVFEFFRNEDLNANDFFFKLANRPRPIVRQNQYGATLGGYVIKKKLFFFGSYEGTKQLNGLASGNENATCSSTISTPPLTNNRSAAAIGALFAGQHGQNGGTAILANGSNINPVALALLNFKLPDGSYMIPTPQIINSSRPFASQGLATFSEPCTYNENQYMFNSDYVQSDRSKFSLRFFTTNTYQMATFPSANVPGTPSDVHIQFIIGSVGHTFIISPRALNDFRLNYAFSLLDRQFHAPYTFSDVGAVAPVPAADNAPSVTITGSYNLNTGTLIDLPQRTFGLQDHFSYVLTQHSLRFGGGVTRIMDDLEANTIGGSLTFLSFPDFLLGLSGAQNGTQFSNVFSSSYSPLQKHKALREWDGFAYIQDTYKVTSRLTLNDGLRFERLSHPTDADHNAVNLNPALINPNPPTTGTLQGYVFPSDWQGTVPPGVILGNDTGIGNAGQDFLEPRLGLAWQILPKSQLLLLRAGYGWFYSVDPGQAYVNLGSQVYGSIALSGTSNSAATFQNPFSPLPAGITTDIGSFFAKEASYSPTTNLTTNGVDRNFRPGLTQQYSMNIQSQLGGDFLLEVGYVGSRSTHMTMGRSLNQANLASATDPIRGVTTDTVANVRLRVPYLGFTAIGVPFTESEGNAWYNSLQTSVTKRMGKGLQFLAAYTWAKELDTDADREFLAGIQGTPAGNQDDPKQRYGPGELEHAQRFVFSGLYQVPNFNHSHAWMRTATNGWSFSGVYTVQSGLPLTILYTNSTNVYGITTDRAQLASNCTRYNLGTTGSIEQRVGQYFNVACLTTPPVVGTDGLATAFGNSGVGLITGPGQNNVDFSAMKAFTLWKENQLLQFRADFFNFLNHPQFNSPNTTFGSSSFGQITSTSVTPRFIQFALKYTF